MVFRRYLSLPLFTVVAFLSLASSYAASAEDHLGPGELDHKDKYYNPNNPKPPDYVPIPRTATFFDLANLRGVDTLVVGGSTVPESRLLPEHVPLSDPFYLAVKDIFSHQSWVTVKKSPVPIEEMADSHVLYLNYGLSARQDIIDGHNIKVAALALYIEKYNSDGPASAIPVLPATYPFVIPTSDKDFQHQLDVAIRYLTTYLSAYMAIANNKPGPPPDPHNDFLTRPFQEKIPGPCPPWAPGQTVPVPCGPVAQ